MDRQTRALTLHPDQRHIEVGTRCVELDCRRIAFDSTVLVQGTSSTSYPLSEG